jgi:hypothetical protein
MAPLRHRINETPDTTEVAKSYRVGRPESNAYEK